MPTATRTSPRPRARPIAVFDFPLDLTQDPITYSNTSVVNLFYWNNWMHDKLYELGFTEAAGNFQSNNFGRGGLGGDPVLAEGQEGYYNSRPTTRTTRVSRLRPMVLGHHANVRVHRPDPRPRCGFRH